MNDITVAEILALHEGILARDGGDARVLSEGNLHQTVFLANLARNPLSRAASVIYTLCAYPAFRDGNKRTAYEVAAKILEGAGHSFARNDPRCFTLMRGISDFTVEIEEIEACLRTIATPSPE
jgi:prophage maintenance system killer protein